MNFVISQILGVIVSASAIVSMQLKNVRWILVCQLICNTLGGFSYILVGGFSGCGIYCVAFTQTVLYYILRAKDIKTPTALSVVFVAAYLTCSVLTYNSWHDTLSAVAAVTCALALSQEKPSWYRFFMFINGFIWCGYDVMVGAYTMIISHAATAISAGVGMYRFDRKKKVQ